MCTGRLIWGVSGSMFGIYSIIRGLNIPLILQPQLFGFLCLVSWGQVSFLLHGMRSSLTNFLSKTQCLYYEIKRTPTVSALMVISLLAVLGGIQAAVICVFKPSYPRNEHANGAVQFFGIFSTVLISLALLPQYYEIYKRKEVTGISMPFMIIDLLGGKNSNFTRLLSLTGLLGVFSDLSLVFSDKFDVVAGISYSMVIVSFSLWTRCTTLTITSQVMDAVVILAAIILNPRAKRRRATAAATPPEEDAPRIANASLIEQSTDIVMNEKG